jgi:hypothetical protein
LDSDHAVLIRIRRIQIDGVVTCECSSSNMDFHSLFFFRYFSVVGLGGVNLVTLQYSIISSQD